MSHQSFVDFMAKLQQDPAMQGELHARLGDPAQGIAVQELAQFAAGKGYQFDVAELQGEVSDQQLDSVSGGALYMKYEGRLPTPGNLFQKYWLTGKTFPLADKM